MTGLVETNGVRALIGRATEIADAVNKIGLPVIILSLVTATYFGWVRSPLGELPQAIQGQTGALREHDGRVTRVIESRAQTDQNLLLVLQALQGEVQTMRRVQQIRTCAEIANLSLREMCLR
jgi:hypothetical protein